MSNIWYCKIGSTDETIKLPLGADLLMRRAIARAYLEITGKEPDFISSGWGAELTEGEQEVVDRNPSDIYLAGRGLLPKGGNA